MQASKWLGENGYEDVVKLIDEVTAQWKVEGKQTRRNWWSVLAGNKAGKPRVVSGREFPVLRAAQARQGLPLTENAICRSPGEEPPSQRTSTRWSNARALGAARSEGQANDPDNQQRKARAVGINHVALEVGDIDEALAFYGRFLDFEIESRSDTAAFIYFGDQFINFAKGREQGPDARRHFGIAVDDKELVRRTLESMGVALLDSRFLDFLDPWGNRVEITTYTNIRYTKADHVLRGMGLEHLNKTEQALAELRAKGMAPNRE